MKKLIIYLLLGFLTIAAYVVMFAPATTAWSLIEEETNKRMPRLQVKDVHGTVWSGGATLRHGDLPESMVTWNIQRLPVLAGTISGELTVQGPGHQVSSTLNLARDHLTIQAAEAGLDSEYLNHISGQYGLNFEGEFTLTGFEAELNGKAVDHLKGDLVWTGGRVGYRTFREQQSYDLPPLKGKLHMLGEVAQLSVTHQGNLLMTTRLKPTGWAEIALLSRLVRLAKLPWPANTRDNEVVLQFEEKIW